jgi:aspartate kinase
VFVSAGTTVLKFGGTSVADAAACARVAEIVRAHGGPRPVVVVSALAGVTNALFAAAAAARTAGVARARDALDEPLARHRAIAGTLLAPAAAAAFDAELDRARAEMAAVLGRLADGPGPEEAALRDELVSYGERLSAVLLAATLAAAGARTRAVDARACIVTDETYGNAAPLAAETERRTRAELLPLCAAGLVPVLGGYIAATRRGRTTTLGRGGSDYTAALVGAALGAREVQIWTDVSGVLTADPRVVPAARPIPRLSYAEAAELAYFGAKVLHPRTLQPAADRRIPVRVCNSRAPEDPGTLIAAEGDLWPGAVKAIAHKTGITVLQIVSARMLGAYGFLRALFEVFDRHRTAVDVVTTSEVSVSLTLEDTGALAAIAAELEALGRVAIERDRAIVCVVGEGLRTTPGIAARIFAALHDINVSLISQGASRVNLTFVVEAARAAEAVRRLHARLLEDAAAAVAAPATPAAPAPAAAPR